MSEFLSSFSKWFGEKANSPLYWTYFGFFVVWNWKFFQIIFLEDASLFLSPRVEYLNTLLATPFGITILDWVANLIWHLLPPVLLTYVAIIYLPQLHRWAFEKYLDHLFERKSMYQERKAAYEMKMAKLTKQEAVAKKERVVQEQIIEKIKTQEEKWLEEFDQIKKINLLHEFQKLVSSIYSQGGLLHATSAGNVTTSDVMAFAGTHDLIQVVDKKYGTGTSQFIDLTEKGKYFSRLLTDKGILVK